MDDRDDLWLESVYSDGTAAFVSSPCPRRGETVTIRLRFYRDAPVKAVFLRTIPNGLEKLIPMTRGREDRGLVYYEAQLKMTENRMQYHFYLVCKDVNWMAIDGLHGGEREVLAKIRYSHKGSPCIIRELPDGTVECRFKEPQRAITPGQAVVFYENECVVGGGTIL